MGSILDTVTISHDVVDTSVEELGWCVNMCLLRPFTAPLRDHRFASSVVTPRGYKVGGRLTQTYVLSNELLMPPHLLPCG
jgi:hypothetical protein